MPKYFLSIVEDQSVYAQQGQASFDEVMQAHGAFAAAVQEAGATIESGEALQPPSTATFLRGTRTANVSVVDNPLPEVKEVVGGYYLIDAPGDDVARKLAELCPAPYGYIELRPVWDMR